MNKKGFAPLGMVLIVVVVLAVIGAVLYYESRPSNPPSASKNSPSGSNNQNPQPQSANTDSVTAACDSKVIATKGLEPLSARVPSLSVSSSSYGKFVNGLEKTGGNLSEPWVESNGQFYFVVPYNGPGIVPSILYRATTTDIVNGIAQPKRLAQIAAQPGITGTYLVISGRTLIYMQRNSPQFMLAYNADVGQEVWRMQFPDDDFPYYPFTTNDALYVLDINRYIAKIDSSNGKILWKAPASAYIVSSTVVYTAAGASIAEVDAQTGKTLKTIPHNYSFEVDLLWWCGNNLYLEGSEGNMNGVAGVSRVDPNLTTVMQIWKPNY